MSVDHSQWLAAQGDDAPLLRKALAAGNAAGARSATLAVAVSGGSDSMAMLHLMARAARQAGWALKAVTVDHRLRREAAEEAAFVGQTCAGLMVPHEVLVWEHGDVPGNLMQAAREARYGLMAAWAKRQGLGVVTLAHTADDQAETFLMGLSRAAGLDGLSGMRPEFAIDGVAFRRPFLSQTRAELRAYLTRHKLPWIDDPSNDNDRFTRIKARRALQALSPLGISVGELSAVISNLSAVQGLVQHAVAVAAQEAVAELAGALRVEGRAFGALHPETRRRLLIAAIRWVSGAHHPPREAKLVALERAVASVHARYGAPDAAWGEVNRYQFPGIDLRLIDLAPGAAGDGVAALLEQCSDEREWIVTRQGVSVNRLKRGLLPLEKIDSGRRSLLQFDKPGRLDSFVWRMADRREPGPGEVEVEIAAAGLNYRDILVGMGTIDEDLLGAGLTRAALGFECSGRIVRVGPDVETFAVGDQVMGFGSGAFTSHLLAPASNFFPVPEGVSLEAAATIPVAFATAWYALVDRANLQTGESVLVHGAAGGVGLAALQIANRTGAQAIGTASNDARRAIARAAGAAHAFPSRNEGFVEEIEKTIGGVDVVLNSLAGQGMLASLKLVKPFGRFIERDDPPAR